MDYSSPSLLSDWEQRITNLLKSRSSDDASHDFFHFQRVWQTAQQIMDGELFHVNKLVVLAACYFHDVVILPKNHPERASASTLAAAEAERCLKGLAFPDELIPAVCHAVKAHSYSAQITPETIEAKVVQDADRMEALGAIGVARVFYTSGILKQKMFDPEDPLAKYRPLDDRQYALDHFQVKLLKIADTMQTETGKQLAQKNTSYLQDYMLKLCHELDGDYSFQL